MILYKRCVGKQMQMNFGGDPDHDCIVTPTTHKFCEIHQFLMEFAHQWTQSTVPLPWWVSIDAMDTLVIL